VDRPPAHHREFSIEDEKFPYRGYKPVLYEHQGQRTAADQCFLEDVKWMAAISYQQSAIGFGWQ
jgi:hypothetical protein